MLPKTGKDFPYRQADITFAELVSVALIEDVGKTHRAVKTLMRWTGASERCVKHWLAGTHAPCGSHLLALMRHSDELLRHLLIAAGRPEAAVSLELGVLRFKLRELLMLMDERLSAPVRH
ncbi:hypothetical protein ATE68_12955 [Sphingopyxis sp. H038]|uniref:hypothetical protein n=1 Tax=unclassified Sphingopyxis TaxID=2614943 RepID=UPI00072FD7DE|nr:MULTISPECIES: hypothetical protein [unclassified Sphingopyxis]KTE03474.1 hypothetical protein ATE78_03460 [Sphingopyxis sp. H012]KTE07980.1 hypothetical protein ATE70_18435 [Sphingopyxis sp. H053]KTE13921.1 hypothetical protein ATE76_10205 [Sphingopyxis sp. H093]KTE23499.1 hypothetical protein ATE75_19240 [Sphingopyxis sp. H080]KTE34234.1 hypothetical protein ATE68_12955 [Sphingopyxis sp. H038]